MALDLSGIKEFVEEEIMVDTCRVTRDPAGNTDQNWNSETGEYDEEDDELIYEGVCYFSGAGTQPREDTEGGADIDEEWYYLNIPLDVDGTPTNALKDGDKVQALTTLRYPHLLTTSWLVQTEQMGSNKIKQKVRMRRAVRNRLR